jgi:hypothetical protein
LPASTAVEFKISFSAIKVLLYMLRAEKAKPEG